MADGEMADPVGVDAGDLAARGALHARSAAWITAPPTSDQNVTSTAGWLKHVASSEVFLPHLPAAADAVGVGSSRAMCRQSACQT